MTGHAGITVMHCCVCDPCPSRCHYDIEGPYYCVAHFKASLPIRVCGLRDVWQWSCNLCYGEPDSGGAKRSQAEAMDAGRAHIRAKHEATHLEDDDWGYE